jgi:hypothetical protein
MKRDRWLHLTFSAVGLITAILGFPSCAFLDSRIGASSVTSSTSTQHVSYHQPSDQPGARQPNDQNRLGVAQTNQDTSLERDPYPGWGPVNFLGGRL